MKKLHLTTLAIFIFAFSIAQESVHIDYIRAHARLAVEEMHKYKIPASIKLSQGILETGGGQSRLAEIANNHFGIKCKSEKEWSGPTITHHDDLPDECFRKYENVQESYRDHSKFLAERPYYKSLFTLDMQDYKAWAHGLRKAGYATNPRYGNILIANIEKYNLHEFDKLTPEQVEMKLTELYGPSNIIALSSVEDSEPNDLMAKAEQVKQLEELLNPQQNTEQKTIKIEVEQRVENPFLRIKEHDTGIQYIVVYEGETIESIAKLYDFNPKTLANYNELPSNGTLTAGQYLFFDKKKNKGAHENYTVKEGDNIYLIAQKTAMRLNRLTRLNNLSAGEQPEVGTVLNLQKRKRR